MRAVVPEGSSVKIELNLMGGEYWFYADAQNWTVSDYVNGKQTFTNLNSGACELEFHNYNTSSGDTILVRFFENGNTETRSRIVVRN